MADTTTTAYGLTKPEIGASEDTWGTKINTDLDTLDTVVNAIGGKTAAATLSYADSAKITTTATGVDVTGTVTVDGNVGIGGSPYAWTTLSGYKAIDTAYASFFGWNGGTGVSQNATLTSAGWRYRDTLTAQRYEQTGGNHIWYNAPSGSSGTAITFSERMQINSSGSVLVAGFSATGVTAGQKIDGPNAITSSSVNTTASYKQYKFYNPNGEVGSISTSGIATAYTTASDYRLKTDAQPMAGASARVQALNPVNFEWISDGTRVDGFLAHEAQAIVPEAVTGTKDAMRDEEYEVTAAIEATYDDDGNELTAAVAAVMGTRNVPDMQGIDQSKLVPLLTAALQEALTKIDAMEARLVALETP